MLYDPNHTKRNEMSQLLQTIYAAKYQLLQTWRQRYSKTDYPRKVALNVLYESLITERMWDREIQGFFALFAEKVGRVDSFQDAFSLVRYGREKIGAEEIKPRIEHEFGARNQIGDLNVAGLRTRVAEATNGSNIQVEEIEFTYTYYTLAHECINAWSACGLMGMTKQQAYENVADVQLGGIDFSSLTSVEAAFMQNVGFFLNNTLTGSNYRPLPQLW